MNKDNFRPKYNIYSGNQKKCNHLFLILKAYNSLTIYIRIMILYLF